MQRIVVSGGLAVLPFVLIGMAPFAVAQESVRAFYRDKTVTVTVGQQAGTGFDLYSRLLVRYMAHRVPGQPAMQVNNMVGASGVVAANWLYNTAPRDGTAMGAFAYTVPLEIVFGNKQARFDPAEMEWIGNMERASAFCGVSKASGIGTFDDLRKSPKEILFGGSGATGPLVTAANAVKNLLGANIRVVPGYKGAVDIKVAILNGELHGVCSMYWSFITTAWRDEFERGDFIPILQHSGGRMSQLAHVAHIDDFIRSKEDQQLFDLVFKVADMARNYAMPPGVPKERVVAMRKSFMDTMRDPGFVADAEKMNIELKPVSGDDLAKNWRSIAETPPIIVEKAREALQTVR